MKSVAALMIFSLCLATVGYSQDVSSNAQGWSILQSSPVGQDLQVNTKEAKSIKGKLDKITDSNLALTTKEGSFSFQSNEATKVYVLRGRPIVKRTLIGAAIGVGAGAGIGFIAGDEKGYVWARTSCACGCGCWTCGRQCYGFSPGIIEKERTSL